MESVLKIDKLKYKDILKDVTFSLDDKSFNILVGSNGSGKTTIVKAIRDLIEYEGNIYIFNSNVRENDNFAIYREVGFFTEKNIILEDIVFNELLNMLLNLDYEEEKAKKKIFSLAKKFDMVDVLYKEIENLTIYENTIISFWFSIVHEPKLLIIDNDLESLDDRNKNRILEYIKSQKKLTTLFITNDSNYFNYANKIFILKDGKILIIENLDEIIENEKNFVKRGSNLPFYIELSNKLKSYELLDSVILDVEDMVNEVWK